MKCEVLKEARFTLFKGTKVELDDKVAEHHLKKGNIKEIKK